MEREGKKAGINRQFRGGGFSAAETLEGEDWGGLGEAVTPEGGRGKGMMEAGTGPMNSNTKPLCQKHHTQLGGGGG